MYCINFYFILGNINLLFDSKAREFFRLMFLNNFVLRFNSSAMTHGFFVIFVGKKGCMQKIVAKMMETENDK
ncbi:hypothetical protein BpHYR1_028644 [Brachionus plicatilis]|uniref:Uncharacterized protein n=1 Tax=Brachionus plicatilis TaxID=10195 RepID=A0A3M7RCP0_BRAPC|nr:hypothetical protein BpHYR1_028644 [Brachionus plicatilis]